MNAKLYLYSNLAGVISWHPNAASFRRENPGAQFAIRVANHGIEPPLGYRSTGRGLAHEPAERIPTVRDLVTAVTP